MRKMYASKKKFGDVIRSSVICELISYTRNALFWMKGNICWPNYEQLITTKTL